MSYLPNYTTNSRPTQATIRTDALRHNLGVVRARAGDAKIWAVVKANAYGHGLVNVFEGLRGADGFACLDLSEAQQLRSLGWRGPILLLEGAFNPRDLELFSRLGLWHVVHCEVQMDWLAAHKTHEGQRVFLKMNSGMNRLGFAPAAYRAAYARLSALPQVAEISHLTHFSDADSDSDAGAHKMTLQAQRFAAALEDLDGEASLGNSAATLRQWAQKVHLETSLHRQGSAAQDDWVRAGIALYGAAPDYDKGRPAQTCTGWGLQPVMTLSSRIVSVQNVAQGEAVGYGSTFVAPVAMRIGIVACGYADGYPRHASSRADGAPVLVDGVRTRTLGRISMDMLAVDLSPVPASGFGSAVTLWGDGLDVDEVAFASGTIGYELLCAVAPRVPFVVIE
jgi:alanine racemase